MIAKAPPAPIKIKPISETKNGKQGKIEVPAQVLVAISIGPQVMFKPVPRMLKSVFVNLAKSPFQQ